MNNDIIKISLKGQIDNDTKTVYTYPTPFNPALHTAEDEWMRSISDPRDARWFTVPRLYAYWKNRQGNYYAIVVPSPGDMRNGRLMVTVFTGNKAVASGLAMVNALNQLATVLIPGYAQAQGDPRIDSIVANLKQHLVVDNTPAPAAPAAGINPLKGYRYYTNDNELAQILEFTQQPEYKNLAKLFAVPQTSTPVAISDPTYKHITAPLRATYRLEPLPEGVRVNKNTFINKDTLVITYSRPGYASEEVSSFIDGKNTRFITYNGSAIRIKSATEAGISWRRGIKMRCVDDQGRSIPNFTYTLNGHTASYSDKKGIIFEAGTTVFKLTIAATGFETAEVTLTEQQMSTHAPITVQLKGRDGSIKLTVYDNNGNPVRGTVQVATTDPLYRLLMANNEMTLGRRAASAGSSTSGSTQRVNFSDDDNTGNSGNSDNKNATLIKGGLAAVACVLAYLLVATIVHLVGDGHIWPYSAHEEKAIVETGGTQGGGIENAGVDNQGDMSPDNQAQTDNNNSDRQYLANNVWNEQDFAGLTAPEWQRFFKMLKVGDTTGLLENPAYSNSGNPDWDYVMNALKNHPDKKMPIAIAIKELSKSGSLNVPTLKDEVTAIVNGTPRPNQQKAAPAPAPQQNNPAQAGPKGNGPKGNGPKATPKAESNTGNPNKKNGSSGSGNNNTDASQGRASGNGIKGNTNPPTQTQSSREKGGLSKGGPEN